MFTECLRCLIGAGSCLLLAVLITVPPAASGQYAEAYFNGSSYVRLLAPISLQSHTGLSFRTCAGGELFAQHTNTSKVSLEVRADGLLFLVVLGSRIYESRLSARLLDNKWYYVSLLYRLGNLTLSVAGHQQVVANGTYNSEILGSDLSSPGSVLIVGEKFSGCILQGPSIVFNTTEVKSHNVVWGQCPMPTTGCKFVEATLGIVLWWRLKQPFLRVFITVFVIYLCFATVANVLSESL